MADLSFIDKLDQEQLQNLDKVITKAQQIGVDPRLAAALAYTESGLRQNTKEGVLTGTAGEIGLMQIKPTTAKLVGYDAKQITDLDANIEAGLTYLKQNLDRYKDPVLGTLAYNVGPDNAFFSGKGEPPEQGLSYVNKIQGLGGFTATPQTNESDVKQEITPASEEDYRSLQAAGLGALAGTGAGTATKAVQFLGGQNAAPKPGTPVEKWAQAMGYQNRGAETFAKAHEAEQGIRKGASIRNPATGQVFKPQFTVAKPPVIAPSMGQNIQSGLQSIGGAMARSPVLTGVLGGAGAGFGGQEAFDRYSKGDKPGAYLAGVGALGSAASVIPTIPTRVLGGALATASPAALAVLDRVRKVQAEPTQQPTQSELQQAQQPAFRYARP